MRDDEANRVIREGVAAWKRLKRGKNWEDWIKVGEALLIGREWAMNQAGTNKPEGKAYNMAFGEWLHRYKLDDMDKGGRSRLFTVMENLPMIEEWRQTLTLNQKFGLNHPQAVLRKWKADVEPVKESSKPTLRDTVVSLQEELDSAHAHIADIEAARELDFTHVDDDAAARQILGWLGRERVPRIILELQKLMAASEAA